MTTLDISSEERQRALDLHNEARREAPGGSRPDLIWSDTLAAAAEEWGKKMIRKMRRQGETQHDPKLQQLRTMGENLFAGEGGTITLSTAVGGWIREKYDYKGGPVTANGKDKYGKMIGHYTQIIRVGTTKVGMAKLKSGTWIYVVARYNGPQRIGELPWAGEPNLPPPQIPGNASQAGPPSPTPGPSASQTHPARSRMDQEIDKILELHNEARREAPGGSRPDLIWSDTLAAAAEKWAKELARTKSWKHDHNNLEMGENLAQSIGYIQSYSSAVRSWIREKKYYHGGAVGSEDMRRAGPGMKEQVGHYTQIIFHPLRKVGMARVTKGDRTYIVARYDKCQIRGTKPWGNATSLPSGAIQKMKADEAEEAEEVSRRDHQRNSTSRTNGRESMLDEIIDGMPRMVIKFPKVSFHPFGKKRSR